MRSLASFSLLVSVSLASSSSAEAKKKFNEQVALRTKVSSQRDKLSIGVDTDIRAVPRIEMPPPQSRQAEDLQVSAMSGGGLQKSPVPLVNVRYESRSTGECFELGINDEQLAKKTLAGIGQLLVDSMAAKRCPPGYSRPPQVQGMPPGVFRSHQLAIQSPDHFPQQAWDHGHSEFYDDGDVSQFPYRPSSQAMHYPEASSQRGSMHHRAPRNSGVHVMPRVQPNTRGPSKYQPLPPAEDAAAWQNRQSSQQGSRAFDASGRGADQQSFRHPRPSQGGYRGPTAEQREEEFEEYDPQPSLIKMGYSTLASLAWNSWVLVRRELANLSPAMRHAVADQDFNFTTLYAIYQVATNSDRSLTNDIHT